MIKPLRTFGFCVLILASTFTAPAIAWPSEVLERIVAVVNDEIITEQDLQIVMAPIVAQYRTMYTGKEYDEKSEKLHKDYLAKVIEDKLILSEAKRKQVIVKDNEVDEMMTEIRNKFPSHEAFLQSLSEQGLTEKKLWNRFRDQLMMQKFVNYEVRSRVSASPGEVSEYYKTHQEEFVQGERARLRHILVRVGSRTTEEARSFAEGLAVQIRGGKAFEEVAKAYSEGSEAQESGDMGWMEKGQLMGQIDEKVFALKEGEITDPLQSSLGFHIFKLVERQASSAKPLSEVRDQIQDMLVKQKLRARLQTWVENLKKNAYISVR